MPSNYSPLPPSHGNQADLDVAAARAATVALVKERLEKLQGKCAFCFAARREYEHVRQQCPILTERQRQEFKESFSFDPETACPNCGRPSEYCDRLCYGTDSVDVVRDFLQGLMHCPPAQLDELMTAAGSNLSRPAPGSNTVPADWLEEATY